MDLIQSLRHVKGIAWTAFGQILSRRGEGVVGRRTGGGRNENREGHRPAAAVYLAVYGVLSASGGYSERLYVGSHRYRFWLGIPTAQLWEPLFVKNTPWERNVPGWVFAPCVWVDRRVWHRDIGIMELFRANRDGDGTDGTPRGADGGQL